MTTPPRTAQCGRTFVHLPHETTAGWCAGLDGTEGGAQRPRPALRALVDAARAAVLPRTGRHRG